MFLYKSNIKYPKSEFYCRNENKDAELFRILRNALSLICLTLSLVRFNSAPITSNVLVSSSSKKYSLIIYLSRDHNVDMAPSNASFNDDSFSTIKVSGVAAKL